MNRTISPRIRFAALGFVVLAISTTTVGTAQAVRVAPEAPSILAPAPSAVAVSQLVTSSQAVNVHAALRDLRGQLAGR